MKTIKMSLANLQGKMTRKEMKDVCAGVFELNDKDGGGTGSKPKSAKEQACVGKKEGAQCSFSNDYGQMCYGKCRAFEPNYILHCSDLN